jgi:hypothetical protein
MKRALRVKARASNRNDHQGGRPLDWLPASKSEQVKAQCTAVAIAPWRWISSKTASPLSSQTYRFAIDQAGANGKLAHRRCDERKSRREIVSGAGDKLRASTIPARQDAEAIMLDFVQPSRTGRRGLGW